MVKNGSSAGWNKWCNITNDFTLLFMNCTMYSVHGTNVALVSNESLSFFHNTVLSAQICYIAALFFGYTKTKNFNKFEKMWILEKGGWKSFPIFYLASPASKLSAVLSRWINTGAKGLIETGSVWSSQTYYIKLNLREL